ncbi:MAG: purine-nucleoside phosphorylase [Ignavibacteria bacterium]|nr:purine-nucleoside phosphorylase [Ignavibacteria bacterium]
MIGNSRVEQALAVVASQIAERPVIGLTLGSGLGDFAEALAEQMIIPTSAIPGYPQSTVKGHEGTLVFGRLRGGGRMSQPLLVFKGRVHYYETTNLDAVGFPVHLAAALGVRVILLTNAAGGIGRGLAAGDLMLITDLLNLAFVQPQVKNEIQWNIDWPGRGRVEMLDRQLLSILRETARDVGIPLREGTYCWLKGPSYETRAEIEMLRGLGVDAVGMSTVPEAMVARKLGMRVAGVSLISNLAAGITAEKLSHDDVTETGKRVKETLGRLLSEAILRISRMRIE